MCTDPSLAAAQVTGDRQVAGNGGEALSLGNRLGTGKLEEGENQNQRCPGRRALAWDFHVPLMTGVS